MYDDDLMDVDLADRPMPSIRRSPMRRFVRNAICEIATWGILFLLAALIVGAVRGDQTVTVKPGRIKKIETTLAGKTFLWRLSGGDADLIPDSNGKSAITLFPAVGEYEVLVITAKGDQPIVEAIKVKVEGDGPKPPTPPDPKPPGPTPDPKPDVAPLPGDGFRVMIIEDKFNLSKMSIAQLSIRTSLDVRNYLEAKCVQEPAGTKAYRIWDHKEDPSGDYETWKAGLGRPRTSLPWIIISNGKTGFEGPLPANVTETLKLLKKYGGE